jgi:hypothetical protein
MLLLKQKNISGEVMPFLTEFHLISNELNQVINTPSRNE